MSTEHCMKRMLCRRPEAWTSQTAAPWLRVLDTSVRGRIPVWQWLAVVGCG